MIAPATGGLCVEFRDGFDVFWLLPGEPDSSIAIEETRPPSAEAVLRDFEILDRRRSMLLDLLRRHLSHRRIGLEMSRTGWSIGQSGWSGGLGVGARITRIAARHGDDFEGIKAALREAEKGQMLGKFPSDKLLQRFLAEQDPPHDLPIPHDDLHQQETPRHALKLMGVCRSLTAATHALEAEAAAAGADEEGNLPFVPTAQQKREATQRVTRAAEEALVPKGRVGSMFLRLVRRLEQERPDVRASALFGEGMGLDFSDGLGHFTINPKGKVRGLIREHGPEAAADRLLEQFLRLNEERTKLICAIKSEALARGMRIDYDVDGWHLGRKYREVRFDTHKALEAGLRRRDALAAAPALLRGSPEFAAAVADRIGRGDFDRALLRVDLPEADLPPGPPQAVELDGPTDEEAAAWDELAKRFLAEQLGNRRRWWQLRTALAWQDSDTWATQEDWQAVARLNLWTEWRGERQVDVFAAGILANSGDMEAQKLIDAEADKAEAHYELPDELAASVWRRRRERPDLAESWFGEYGAGFEHLRAKMGDPIALRATALDLLEDEELPSGSTFAGLRIDWLLPFLPPGVVEAWRERAVREVESAWDFTTGGPDKAVELAVWLGWPEVGEALENNPYLPRALVNGDAKDVFGDDRPPVLKARSLLLSWSLLNPRSPRLLSLATFALRQDLRAGITEWTRKLQRVSAAVMVKSGLGQYDDPDGERRANEGIDNDVAETLSILLIVWTRCRSAASQA